MAEDEVFTLAGLTSTESRVLAALLKLGPATPSAISKATGMFRRQVYDALDRLAHRNLASFIIKNNRRVYSATESDAVVKLLKKRRDDIDAAIPKIASAYISSAKENVTILTGINGLKMVLNTTMEVLKQDPKKNTYNVMRTDISAIRLLGNWLRRWHQKRASLGLNAKLVFTSDAAWRGKQLENLPHTWIRYVPGPIKIPVGLHSCGEYAWVIFWGEESPLAIQIKDEKIARAFDEYFEIMWEAADRKPPKPLKMQQRA
ncbi:MAG: helix-turn-helix domain-containing protein [Candidatus Micrarchaeota archaeon]